MKPTPDLVVVLLCAMVAAVVNALFGNLDGALALGTFAAAVVIIVMRRIRT